MVDDDDAVRETCCALLENSFDVTSAATGEAALALLASHQFDVLLTDYKMPGMHGLELIIRSARLKGAPSPVLVTAYAEYAMRDRAESTPPFRLLLKPYSSAQLLEMVRRAYEVGQMQRQLAHITSPGTATR